MQAKNTIITKNLIVQRNGKKLNLTWREIVTFVVCSRTYSFPTDISSASAIFDNAFLV